MRSVAVVTLAMVAGSLILSGCAGNKVRPEPPAAPAPAAVAPAANSFAQLPDWILNPHIEGGIGSAECVVYTHDMGLDKAEAVANARADLAKQIQVKVEAMDKTYKRKVRATGNTSSGGTFESVSRQVASQFLSGSRVIRMEQVMIDNKSNLCVLVALNPSLTKELFDALVDGSNQQVSPADRDMLYEEFRAAKAQEEMDKYLQEMSPR